MTRSSPLYEVVAGIPAPFVIRPRARTTVGPATEASATVACAIRIKPVPDEVPMANEVCGRYEVQRTCANPGFDPRGGAVCAFHQMPMFTTVPRTSRNGLCLWMAGVTIVIHDPHSPCPIRGEVLWCRP